MLKSEASFETVFSSSTGKTVILSNLVTWVSCRGTSSCLRRVTRGRKKQNHLCVTRMTLVPRRSRTGTLATRVGVNPTVMSPTNVSKAFREGIYESRHQNIFLENVQSSHPAHRKACPIRGFWVFEQERAPTLFSAILRC